MQDLTYARNAGVVDRTVGSQLFLINDRSGRIHAVEGAAAGVWNLLETPQSMSEMLEVFRVAFPEQAPKSVRSFLTKALSELERRRLVGPA